MTGSPRPRVEVLAADPDLAVHLSPEDLELARRRAVAGVRVFEAPEWEAAITTFDGTGHLGLLVLDGLLARRVTIGSRTCAELLGPGDLLRPWVKAGPSDSVLTDVDWSVVATARIAVLDREFALRIAQWPEIIALLGDRILLRARWLAVHLAICHVVRVDARLRLVLWHFADRWGRVTPEGVVLPLRLTHRLLAMIVGARRPSVTTAATRLAEQDLVHRREDGSWLLKGESPRELATLHEQLSAPAGPSADAEPC